LLLPTTTKGGHSPNETTFDDCQIAYTFVIVGNQEGANLNNKSILEENAMHNDVLLLPYNADDPKMTTGRADSELSSQFSFSDNSRHTQLAQSLAWFHYATTNHHLAELPSSTMMSFCYQTGFAPWLRTELTPLATTKPVQQQLLGSNLGASLRRHEPRNYAPNFVRSITTSVPTLSASFIS
jgi:hypothetical protein